MRKDMLNVVVDPPKGGGWDGYLKLVRAAKHFKLDYNLDVFDEFTGTKISMKRGASRCRRENYTALPRFLNRQVGRLWNDVYSEICQGDHKNLSIRLRDMIKWHVAIKVVIGPDGKIYEYDSHGIWPLNSGWHCRGGHLYVNPETGILCRLPFTKKNRYHHYSEEARKKEENTRRFGEFIFFERHDRGPLQPVNKNFVYSDEKVWIRYDYVPANPRDIYRVYNKDHTAFVEAYPYEVKEINGKTYRLTSKSASKKDIKKYVLNRS